MKMLLDATCGHLDRPIEKTPCPYVITTQIGMDLLAQYMLTLVIKDDTSVNTYMVFLVKMLLCDVPTWMDVVLVLVLMLL